MNSTPPSSQDLLRSGRRLRRELLERKNLQDVRIAVLGGSTTNELCSFLEIILLEDGYRPVFFQSEYGAYFEEAVLDSSRLKSFEPDIVHIHTSYRNLRRLPSPTDGPAEVAACLRDEVDKLRAIWDAIRENVGCQIVQNNFERPPYSMLGSLDTVHPTGLSRFVAELNVLISQEIASRAGVLLLDINSLSTRIGLQRWNDNARWFSYKLAHTPDAHRELARSMTAIIRAIYGRSRKVLVLDLDNTLWGGVIGDDGADKIQIGRETAPAEAFTAFQEYCLRLRARGILLAVCSKNNDDVAKSGLAHPDSLLRLEHFSAFRANWQPKHENILSMAKELNLGVDSFVFVDDNPAERALVAAQLPMVAVPDVGSDATQYGAIIDDMRYFESVALSDEDLQRAALYAANSERTAMTAQFADYSEYLASLEMTAEIDTFQSVYLDRITQLTNKTNQFNLTTRRYSLAEIQALSTDPSCVSLYGRLADRFGDNGLVTVVVGHREGDTVEIDLWLMSCRVLKRDMEVAMLDALAARAIAIGATKLRGAFIPSAKNSMVADHYARLGFVASGASDDGVTFWELSLSGYAPRSRHIHQTTFVS